MCFHRSFVADGSRNTKGLVIWSTLEALMIRVISPCVWPRAREMMLRRARTTKVREFGRRHSWGALWTLKFLCANHVMRSDVQVRLRVIEEETREHCQPQVCERLRYLGLAT